LQDKLHESLPSVTAPLLKAAILKNVKHNALRSQRNLVRAVSHCRMFPTQYETRSTIAYFGTKW
jgi:hypothetical protein